MREATQLDAPDAPDVAGGEANNGREGAASGQFGGQGLDKSGRAIRDMFAGVARRYDLLNHLLSAGLDLVWRRQAAAALAAPAGATVLVGAAGGRPRGMKRRSLAGDGGLQSIGSPPTTPADPLPGFPEQPPGPCPAVAVGEGDAPAPDAQTTLFLDLCCGTGDQAAALGRRGASVAAADFCVPMLALARRKFRRLAPPRPRPLAADALALPFPARRFAGAVVAFGLRNVADLDAALRQLASVLRPGGRLVVLEFAIPEARPLRALYLLYFRRLLPWIGRLISARGSAYSYLPESVLAFPQRRGFLDRMAGAGFADLGWRDLSLGIVCLYSGTVSSASSRTPSAISARAPETT
ncbi:MAG TPA: ubiquinone/menaquinone biosynthesis methyltransferase [Thermoanaerobaculia bacterium]|nr:ubiquinone/menaquinone biosynthesis methyltransferase [Thermoanaerobaculia bacterium]